MRTSGNVIAAPGKPCVACGEAAQAQLVYEKCGFPIFRCVHCGHGTTGTPADFDPAAIYTDDYFNGARVDSYPDYAGSEAVLRREFHASVRALRSAGCRGGMLFELGAAYGYFLDEARAHFTVAGAEMAPAAALACRTHGLDVSCGDLSAELLAPYSPLDAFVMLDVIEHLTDPFAILKLARRHMRPGARLLITTGDWTSIPARLMRSRWRLMTPPQHLHFFSQSTLTKLLARTGFRVERVTYPTKLVSVNHILFVLARVLGLPPKKYPALSSKALPVNLFDAMRVIAVADGIVPDLPAGSSGRERADP